MPRLTEPAPNGVAGKSIILTGGETGIGKAAARLLFQRGANVLIVGINKKQLDQTVREIRALREDGEVLGIVADVSKERDVKRAFAEADKRLDGVDVLVNNAAIHAPEIETTDFRLAKRLLDVNVLGYFACCKEAIARMRKKGGHIINVGSISGDMREPGHELYVASKAAIEGFTESLGKSLSKRGIRTTVIEPGGVATPLLASTSNRNGKDLRRMVRNKEILDPNEIAEAVYYVLAQPERCDVSLLQIRPMKNFG
jgi:NAD(P)-dependent dehydrogenase (short-subunit alcohol dehydrogenase family)